MKNKHLEGMLLCALIVSILVLTGCSGGGSSSKNMPFGITANTDTPFTVNTIVDNIKTIPTEKSVSQIGTGAMNKSSMLMSISPVSGETVSTIHGELTHLYTYLQFNRLAQDIVATHASDLMENTLLNIGDISFDGRVFGNCIISYSYNEEELIIFFGYDLDSNIRRKAKIIFSNRNDLNSGIVTVSYIDIIADESIYDGATEDVELTYYSNMKFVRSEDSFYLYTVFKKKYAFEHAFRLYSQYFAMVYSAQCYNIYRSFCYAYENYNGIPWFESEIPTERNYVFIDLENNYAAKTIAKRAYYFFDEKLELQYYYFLDGDKNISARWPIKNIADIDNAHQCLYDDDGLGSIFIDLNDNCLYDENEPIMKTGMDSYTQIYTDNSGLRVFTNIVSVSGGQRSGKEMNINIYNNPDFNQFIYARESYIRNLYDTIMDRLDSGMDSNYFLGNANYNTEKPLYLLDIEI